MLNINIVSLSSCGCAKYCPVLIFVCISLTLLSTNLSCLLITSCASFLICVSLSCLVLSLSCILLFICCSNLVICCISLIASSLILSPIRLCPVSCNSVSCCILSSKILIHSSSSSIVISGSQSGLSINSFNLFPFMSFWISFVSQCCNLYVPFVFVSLI